MMDDNQMEHHHHHDKEELEQAQAKLRAAFKKIPHKIPLFLFTSPGRNEPYNQAGRQVISVGGTHGGGGPHIRGSAPFDGA